MKVNDFYPFFTGIIDGITRTTRLAVKVADKPGGVVDHISVADMVNVTILLICRINDFIGIINNQTVDNAPRVVKAMTMIWGHSNQSKLGALRLILL